MPPRKQSDIVHDNGALQTVFDADPSRKRSGRSNGKAKAAAIVEDGGIALPPIIELKETPKRKRGRKAREARAAAAEALAQPPLDEPLAAQPEPGARPIVDGEENPFVSSSHHPSPPVENETVQLSSDASNSTQQLRLHSVAIPSTQTPRAGQHSPSRASSEVGAARQKSRHTARDVRAFFQMDKGRWHCKFCLRDHGAPSSCDSYKQSSSTSTLRRHLYTKHLQEWVDGCKKAGIKITATESGVREALEEFNRYHDNDSQSAAAGGPVPIYRAYSPDAFVDAIVEWIVADDQSLNVIENPHLRSIFLMLRKELRDKDIPHRMTIRNRAIEVWEKHLKDLEKDMKKALGKISFTADCWTDSNLAPFMAITAHWLEGQVKNVSNGPRYIINLRSELIAFHRVPGRHTGGHLATVFLNILDRYKIRKVGWITLDNASNNDTMVESLESQLTARGIEFSSEDQRIRCFPHIVNIAVQAVLDSVTNMDYAKENAEHFDPTWSMRSDIIASLRTLVNKIRASSLRRQQFAHIQEEINITPVLQLIRDVSTRWSSTHLMISRVLQLRRAIDIYLSENSDLSSHKLHANDWEMLRAYSKILAVPHAFQQKLSSEKIPTLCEALPSFQRLIVVWEDYQKDMPIYAPVIEAGLKKLRDYYNRVVDIPAYQLAILLNPSKKLNWFVQNLPHKVEQVRQTFFEHLKPYQPSFDPRTPRPKRTTVPVSKEDEWADEILGMDSSDHHEPRRSLHAEIDAYFLDTVPASYTSMIAFWQENQLRYPTIFMLAMDILAIQGSAVPCERVFSSGKETMTARRNRIKYDLMEALQMLKFSFKRGSGLDFTAGLARQAEFRELEELDAVENAIPEDLSSFRRTFMLSLDDDDSPSLFDSSDFDSDTSSVLPL